MKTLGLIGGMSWESTALYYKLINEAVKQRLGGLHSARLLLHSVDFHDIEALQRAGDWDEAGRRLATIARSLAGAGAEAIVLCTNTMHRVAEAVERAAPIPLLHIADPTARAVKAAGLSRIGLLGTRFTMEQAFYAERLRRHGLEPLVPDEPDRGTVHDIIYGELCLGVVKDASRDAYRRVIDRLLARGAQGIILGCTEICMLIGEKDLAVPAFDTTRLHAVAAAEWMVAG
jgi:aspartate racemase